MSHFAQFMSKMKLYSIQIHELQRLNRLNPRGDIKRIMAAHAIKRIRHYQIDAFEDYFEALGLNSKKGTSYGIFKNFDQA